MDQVFEIQDKLVQHHRNHIDTLMTLIKKDMHLLKEFDRMEIQSDDYGSQLESIISEKIESLNNLKKTLKQFTVVLKEEERVGARMATEFKEK